MTEAAPGRLPPRGLSAHSRCSPSAAFTTSSTGTRSTRCVPTIGPLFLLNFIGATALGLFLLAPLKSRLGGLGKLLDQLAALAGVGLAASGLAALLISEHTPLFGFMEHGYRFVIVFTIASEAAAIAMLTLFLVQARSHSHGRGATPPHGRSGAPPAGGPINQPPVAPAAER